MDKRNLQRTEKAMIGVQRLMNASFVPGRLIVNKIKARRFTLAGLRVQRAAISAVSPERVRFGDVTEHDMRRSRIDRAREAQRRYLALRLIPGAKQHSLRR